MLSIAQQLLLWFILSAVSGYSPPSTSTCHLFGKLKGSTRTVLLKGRRCGDGVFITKEQQQHWVLAEAVDHHHHKEDGITTSRPDWALPPEELILANNREKGIPPSLIISPENPTTWKIQNESPLWVTIMAKIVVCSFDGSSSEQIVQPSYYDDSPENRFSSSSLFEVTPVFGCLAPKGGTTNLCNEKERYQDFCEFRVSMIPSPSSSSHFPPGDKSTTNQNNDADVKTMLVIQSEENENWVLEIITA